MKVETEQKQAPELQENEAPVILEFWRVCEPGCNFAGRRDYRHLTGIVYNHPNLPDGVQVCTSELITLSPPVAMTKSRVYHLGKPAP